MKMMMEMAGGGAAVPLSSDEMDLRSLCDFFCSLFMFAAVVF
jgi:hypothetical protein